MMSSQSNVLSTLRAEFIRLPVLTRSGLLVFGTGGVLDVLVHMAPAALPESMHNFLGHDGYTAHLVTIAGMLTIVLGIVSRAVRQPASRVAEEQE